VSFKVITNIKIIGLKDLVNFASASGDGNISRLTSSDLRSLFTYMQTFYPEVARVLQKMEINLVE